MSITKINRLPLYLSLLALLGLFLFIYTWQTYTLFTSHDAGGNDFFSRYVAWRAWVFEGHNPYSDQVTQEIQIDINGHPARPGEDENALIYPWYAFLVQWPFIFLPWKWARALYIVTCQIFIVAGLGLTAKLLNWQLSRLAFAVTAVWAIFFYPEARGILLGQIVITQYIFMALALWLMHEKHDGWAGICLAFSTVKPPPVIFAILFLLLFAAVRRRFRLIWAFGLTLTVFALVGFSLLPTWLGDWLYRAFRYPSYTVGQPPVWLLTHEWTHGGDGWELLLSLLFLIGMGLAWLVAFKRKDEAAFHWAFGVTFVVTDLILLRSATTSYIFLLFPIYLIFAALTHTWPRAGMWGMIGLQVVGFISLWWLFISTVQGNQEQPIMFVPLPVVLALVLGLGYRWLIEDNRQAQVTI
jgi:hypothetical protein